MKIIVTGATGFIGKNLCERLECLGGDYELHQFNSQSSEQDLYDCLRDCDILYNFAAVHRPKDSCEFNTVNVLMLQNILDYLKKNNNKCMVVELSSIQAGDDTPYGISKLKAEELIDNYSKETGNITHVIRLTNCFGKYARPNTHSVVATFCYNISRDMPITINNQDAKINLCYVDDVIDMLVSYMDSDESTFGYFPKEEIHTTTVGRLADILQSFQQGENLECEKDEKSFVERLKTTYDWYSNN